MAFVEDENDPAGQPAIEQEQTPETASGVSGGGSSLSATPGPQGQGAQSASGSKGPPVQNLHAYLQANAPQAIGMGQTIAKDLESGYQAVNQNIENAGAQFGEQVQASAPPSNAQDIVKQAASNPTQFVQDPNNVSQFQQVQNANYKGPSNFEGSDYYQNLNQEIQNAQMKAPDISNPANIEQLVRGQAKNPTTGMANLDSMLLMQSPEGVSAIKAAAEPYQGLDELLESLTSGSNQKIYDTQASVDQARGFIPEAFYGGENAVVPKFQQSLANQLAQAQQKATNYNSQINQNVQKINPINSYLNQWQGLTGLSIDNPLTQYLSQKPLTDAPTRDTVSTSDDYAMDAALEKLLGAGYSPFLSESNASKAGSFNTPEVMSPDIASLINQIALGATNAEAARLPPVPPGSTGPIVPQPGHTPPIVPITHWGRSFAATKQSPAYAELLKLLQPYNPDAFSSMPIPNMPGYIYKE